MEWKLESIFFLLELNYETDSPSCTKYIKFIEQICSYELCNNITNGRVGILIKFPKTSRPKIIQTCHDTSRTANAIAQRAAGLNGGESE